MATGRLCRNRAARGGFAANERCSPAAIVVTSRELPFGRLMWAGDRYTLWRVTRTVEDVSMNGQIVWTLAATTAPTLIRTTHQLRETARSSPSGCARAPRSRAAR